MNRIEFLRSMRRRRVGVTARSRRNDGNQATGTPQFVTEMAAPLELRTPTGTSGGSCKQSADGSMATMARETTGRSQSEERSQGERDWEVERTARNARMRRCLMLRQGASPLRPPAPFPSGPMFQNGGNLSRVRKPRRNGAPLTDCHRSEETTEMRERGPTVRAGRSSSGGGALCAHEALPHTPSGGKPPETPNFPLDRGWPSHGSRDREGAILDALSNFRNTAPN